MKRLRKLPPLVFHPFLFAIYPTLAVMAGSLGILDPIQAVRPFLLILLFATLMFLFLYMMLKDLHRAGFVLSILIFMLLYYGYSYKLPKEINMIGLTLSRHVLTLLFWAIFLPAVLSSWVWKRVRPRVITKVLNISSFIALLLPLRLIAAYLGGLASDPLSTWQPPPPPDIAISESVIGYKPDIYYIIVDGYARQDVLKEYYGLDNSKFLDFLDRRGFYVADESTSNYSQTALSLASSMNFETMDDLAFAGDVSKNHDPLKELMLRSKTRYILEQAGYKVHLSGELLFAQERDPAVIFYSPNYKRLTVLESLILETSMMEIVIEQWDVDISDYTYQRHRERVLDAFSQIQRLVDVDSPKFAFVHIIAPHPPFVFDRDGSPVEPDGPYNIFDATTYVGGVDEYITGYTEQLLYINTLLEETIDYILNHSDDPPIILLQADHGPAAYFDWKRPEESCIKERFSILNAYYLPQGKEQVLYGKITPVNTFRLIFDEYFNTQLGLLEEKNYYSSSSHPYKFIDVTHQVELPCNVVKNK